MNRQLRTVLLILLPSTAVIAAVAYVLVAGLWMIVLSAGIFLSVSMGLAAIFSQPGEIRMSAQRAAALATGHIDRRTVFEQQWLRPIVWVLLVISHRASLPRGKDWLRRTLVAAGSPNYYTPEEYLALSMLAGLMLGALLTMVNFAVYQQFSLIAFAGGLAVGVAMTLAQLHEKAARRIRQISKRVPYALDLIALAMGAGATFTEAVKTVVREQSDDPFNVELRTMLAEMELGTTRRKALMNLADRVPLDPLRSIIASVVQSEDLGTPLGDVLHDQATLLRQQRSVRAENAAAVASVRILVPCLLLVMAVILTVFGPMILRIFRGGLF
ncbi:MAG TPA: type II secretion system F family protein [Phycisphaerae bacterium]|nr:type II secretion system F family protein [Phycisphaerae bacterium]